MKVLHIVTLSFGEVIESARRLHEGMRASGLDSRLLYLVPGGEGGEGEALYPTGLEALWRRFKLQVNPFFNPLVRHNRAIRGADLEFDEAFTSIRSDVRFTSTPEYRDCDLVHLHWAGNFLDWPSFFAINDKPVVWSLHDINPLTGGCQYNRGCLRYQDEQACVACPILSEAKDPNLAERAMREKLALEAGRQWELVFLAASESMREKAKASRLFPEVRTEILPFLGRESAYDWRSEASSREALRIDPERPTLLFVGDGYSRVKGSELLLEAFATLPADACQLLLAGEFSEIEVPDNVVRFGRVNGEKILGALYGAASMIVIPSVEESLTPTFIDSQMVGTPSLVLSGGGVSEYVVDGINGLVAEEASVESLAVVLRRWLDGEVSFDRKAIAARAAERFSWEVLGSKYLDLYGELVSS